jgi:5-methylcytosine-specific restriction endonuclease McrA
MITDNPREKVPQGTFRSTHWPTVRKNFLKDHPFCSVCGGTKKLEVHHKIPFHRNPSLELEPTNLITLCENKKDGVNCHLLFGHLGDFKSFNENVEEDAKKWNYYIKHRPKSGESI